MRSAALLCLAASLACSHATIPGTPVRDSPENRAVLDVFSRYLNAMNARDATALYALAAPSYYDAGDPSHSLAPTDYASLQKKLQTDFSKVTGLKLEATIKDLQIKDDEAHVDFFQVLRYAVAAPTGEKWKSDSDDARMRFVKVNGEWKIASGL